MPPYRSLSRGDTTRRQKSIIIGVTELTNEPAYSSAFIKQGRDRQRDRLVICGLNVSNQKQIHMKTDIVSGQNNKKQHDFLQQKEKRKEI